MSFGALGSPSHQCCWERLFLSDVFHLSAAEGEASPRLSWLLAGLCRQDTGREGKEERITPRLWALAISG